MSTNHLLIYYIYKSFLRPNFKSQTEENLKFKNQKQFCTFVTEEIKSKFSRLNFYKNDDFVLDEEDGLFHLNIVPKENYLNSKIVKKGVEEIYSAFKYVFNTLNIDFKKLLNDLL